MYDSIFSDFSDRLPFASDRPYLSEKRIAEELGALERGGAGLLRLALERAWAKLWKNLENAINRQDVAAIQKAQWSAVPELQKILRSLWVGGLQLGGGHGQEEIELAIAPKRAAFGIGDDPNPRRGVRRRNLVNSQAEQAIQQRINRLATDVSNSEFTRIKQHLLAAVVPASATEPPISRAELLQRIESELGAKAGRYPRRAETIARTELTWAYNAGRLETYRQSGLVRAVRYLTIYDERRCQVCAARQGLVVPLDDVEAIAEIAPPLHPNCRCVLSPVLATPEGQQQQTDPDRSILNRELVPAPAKWMSAAILAAILLGQVRPASAPSISSVSSISRTTVPAVAAAQAISQIREAIGESQARTVTSPATSTQPPDAAEEQAQPVGGAAVTPLIPPPQPPSAAELWQRLNAATTPSELWLANLGLNRAQARKIFRELQKGPFTSNADLRDRLRALGLTNKTIDRLMQAHDLDRARLQVRASLPETLPVRQGVGVGAPPPPALPPRIAVPPAPIRLPADIEAQILTAENQLANLRQEILRTRLELDNINREIEKLRPRNSARRSRSTAFEEALINKRGQLLKQLGDTSRRTSLLGKEANAKWRIENLKNQGYSQLGLDAPAIAEDFRLPLATGEKSTLIQNLTRSYPSTDPRRWLAVDRAAVDEALSQIQASPTLSLLGLDEADATALLSYVGDGYAGMDAVLKGQFKEAGAEMAQLATQTVRQFNEVIEKLPTYAGKVYRGTSLPRQLVEQDFQPGNIISLPGLIGTSPNPAAIRTAQFPQTSYAPVRRQIGLQSKATIARQFGPEARVEFAITSRQGRRIPSVFVPAEEVVFRSGTQFEVLSADYNSTRKIWNISLEELP